MMIMITSPAGQRLAKARSRLLALISLEQHATSQYIEACEEMDDAADALADELIEGNHHLVEGD